MKKLLKIIKVYFISHLILLEIATANSSVSSKDLSKNTKAIVTINSRVSVSAYNNIGKWQGTGFIADKKNGLIVTNSHVTGGASIGTYFITFYNGQQSEAKVVYYDIWQDFAILKLNPNDLPFDTQEINFSKVMPKINEQVLVVGNTEAQDFSFHTGNISSLYDINGDMPQGSYVVNLNIAGGASGSPVLNEKNEAIGVLYGGGKTYALVLHGNYVSYALEAIKLGQLPKRRHIGIITESYSLDKAVRHRSFPKEEMDKYIKNYPDARNRVVAVQSVISGSPAMNLLQPGDILWTINGRPVGGNLTLLDQVMNESLDKVTLEVFRDGKILKIKVPLYDVNSNKIERIVNFGGATFFESDDFSSAKSGVPLKSVFVINVQSGSSFSELPVQYRYEDRNIYRMKIQTINNSIINNLEDMITSIEDCIKQKFISIRFKNHEPYFQPFQGTIISSQDDFIGDITLDSIDTKPRLLKFDRNSLDWITEEIGMDNKNIKIWKLND